MTAQLKEELRKMIENKDRATGQERKQLDASIKIFESAIRILEQRMIDRIKH